MEKGWGEDHLAHAPRPHMPSDPLRDSVPEPHRHPLNAAPLPSANRRYIGAGRGAEVLQSSQKARMFLSTPVVGFSNTPLPHNCTQPRGRPPFLAVRTREGLVRGHRATVAMCTRLECACVKRTASSVLGSKSVLVRQSCLSCLRKIWGQESLGIFGDLRPGHTKQEDVA
jgi:hypothetical protein